MSEETEVKLRVEDLDLVRQRLRALGAVQGYYGLESNVVFDDADGRLMNSDELLRLRSYESTLLTFKGPRCGLAAIKTRSEFEVEVSDAAAAEKLLAALGYKRTWVYEKMRGQWRLGDVSIMLDRLPYLGDFVEVEGPGAAEVSDVVGRLGYSEDDFVRQTYAELFREHLARQNEDFRDLVFEKE